LARSVPLSRFTPRAGGGSAFFVRRLSNVMRKRIIILLSAGAVLFAIVWLIILWSTLPSAPRIHLTFLYATNDLSVAMGAFRLENHSAETVSADSGFFEREHENSVAPRSDDFGFAMPAADRFCREGSSYTFTTWIPSGARFRLVICCTPDSKVAHQYQSSYRMRLAGFVSRLPAGNSLALKLAGKAIVKSQWFQASPPNKSPEPTAVGAVSSAIAVHVASRRWLSFLR